MTGKKFNPNMGGGLPGLVGNLARPTVLPGMASNVPGQINVQSAPRPKSADEVRHARTLNGKPIGLVPDFITEEERATLYDYASDFNAPWETYLPESDVWHGRMINPRSMSPNILKLMEKIRKRTVAHIKADYEIDDPVYADTLQLVRWRPGDNQKPHADCEEPDGRPNGTPWRAFASIIYLNDGYEGGGIHFPDRKLKPEIKPRMLAYFPSTNSYRHGVEAITSGLRYTFSCFYTFDPRRHDGHPV
ncbi:2OG-Fe(II) oxygenase [Erythrobacter sp. F6033]|uniref:2OG-Fe(II) oxygenase n=1 Tax=Erythrobacter sp. F6033 TaxID=2926401 RepID=UPI001FF3491E|nr:2OG-Fe(II) oxygenase [Erythrobacter sp. F6033]MCK0128720.1 2OG-Fe(II) oxygenase [Erythrobacter sp. F6033]